MQADSNSSEVIVDDFEVLVKDTIKGINSSTISESRKILLITTSSGFVLCDLVRMQYARYTPAYSGLRVSNLPSMSRRLDPMGRSWDLFCRRGQR
jgi:hypothetical protein